MMKKKCPRCGGKIKGSYEFCPNCGVQLRKKNDKDGLLGKNDYLGENEFFNEPRGFSEKIIDKMMGSALRMIEKEMLRNMPPQINPPNQNTRIKLMINGKEINLPEKNIQKKPKEIKRENNNTKKLPIEFSKENLKKFKRMKKAEPATDVRRIGDKIVYELKVPGVKSINDISISKMEEGLEVKAVGEKKAYSKNISINFPLIKYALSKGKLSLEMDAKE
ncbi:hypothetical protein B6U91_01220 [Candidatus Pacearchaeota archaeon ex4484_71]|nr:MAG: hypothetical protein B6U91_01220 [Candidatus Pacearchaeota archaeon ex4484_71]